MKDDVLMISEPTTCGFEVEFAICPHSTYTLHQHITPLINYLQDRLIALVKLIND